MLSEIYKRFPRDMKKSNLFCASFSYNSSLGFFFIYLISRSKMQNSKYRTFSKDNKYRIFCLVTTNFSNKDMLRYILALVAKKNKNQSRYFWLNDVTSKWYELSWNGKTLTHVAAAGFEPQTQPILTSTKPFSRLAKKVSVRLRTKTKPTRFESRCCRWNFRCRASF